MTWAQGTRVECRAPSPTLSRSRGRARRARRSPGAASRPREIAFHVWKPAPGTELKVKDLATFRASSSSSLGAVHTFALWPPLGVTSLRVNLI